MPLPPLPLEAIAIGVHVSDWRAAVTAAGDALERSGSTGPEYTRRMIAVIDEFGAYVVIAPGLALAHARPGPDVHSEGLSIVTLAEPVPFGHPHNDPVSVVLGLAVTSSDEHVLLVAELANVFNDPAVIPALAAATDVDTIRSLLGVSAAIEESS
ncbi:PTS sugar transporter subunit IIA [Cryobacterium sp. TMT1-21]|uniref:Ascorbate-specific PTS system EIIA component n=1 Tax=Cryobacterium shii TaxID=1259235 RepID=A0AAQ2HG29_9MICO|nr:MULTISPECIES: PTS sugar transporter subunit IIA [Cryobacterium]TFC49400.1 PTS sugar transporter subunit IIA [Cryobacterium shii]TFC85630.1 PTS sugar transporter subunit IIA [Cryobacterium sp. TmT2-59]TFD15237.1 PTS sugar transporter subunit IIA [Cryobacterium sp. TMT1-21]TFD20268.1 PTS sugar transporter subunit IIA [Cryobacterium sp. TMT2-23]TFD20764.1 PTS sugar transporter subunit IIA [Cryobacterium sp. TMT4-10]